MKILIKTLTDFSTKFEPFLRKAVSKLSSKKFRESVKWEGERYAKLYLEELKLNILTNKFHFVLKPSTIARKRSNIPWVETNELLKVIVRKGDRVVVEESRRKSKRSNGLTNKELAMILEFGRKDKSIPARPVFRLTMRDFRKRAKKDLQRKCKRTKNK